MDEQPDKKRRRSLGGSFLMCGLVLAVVAAGVWANLWKSDLRIAEIRVVGSAIITEGEILNLAAIDKEQRLYDVDLLAVGRRIMQNAFIKSAVVNREVPNRIVIIVQERIPIAAVVLDNIKYLDAEGVVLPPAQSENIFDLPVLTGEFKDAAFIPGKQCVGGDVQEALEILATAQELSDRLYRGISEVHVDGGRDIFLYTADGGAPVIFGHGNTAVKLAKFDGFWKDVILHCGTRGLLYVDLRFEEQVVVRWSADIEKAEAAREQKQLAGRNKS